MAEEKFLSIVIPAHNEEHRLPASLARIQESLASQAFSSEVIVVENGSRDRTAAVAAEVASHFPDVRLLRTPLRGKGRAVRLGMLAAQGAFRFQCDADLSMPIEEVVRFLPPQVEADVVIGSREAGGARRYGEPLYRHLMGRLFALAVKALVLKGHEDTQCGFKCYRAHAAQTIFSLQRLHGWTFDVEDLFLAQQLGYRVVEVPIPWYYQAESRVHVARDSLGMLVDLLRIRWYFWRGLYGRPPGRSHPYPSH